MNKAFWQCCLSLNQVYNYYFAISSKIEWMHVKKRLYVVFVKFNYISYNYLYILLKRLQVDFYGASVSIICIKRSDQEC